MLADRRSIRPRAEYRCQRKQQQRAFDAHNPFNEGNNDEEKGAIGCPGGVFRGNGQRQIEVTVGSSIWYSYYDGGWRGWYRR